LFASATSLATDLEKIFTNKLSCDIVINVKDGKQIPAHKIILKINPAFKELISKDTTELTYETNKYTLTFLRFKTLEYDCVYDVILFIYTGLPRITADVKEVINVATRFKAYSLLRILGNSAVQEPDNLLAQSMSQLLDDRDFSDVTFISEDDVVFHGHKLILSRSEYFKAMFSNNMMEMQQEHIPMPMTADLLRACK
jgi:hypothetical protein